MFETIFGEEAVAGFRKLYNENQSFTRVFTYPLGVIVTMIVLGIVALLPEREFFQGAPFLLPTLVALPLLCMSVPIALARAFMKTRPRSQMSTGLMICTGVLIVLAAVSSGFEIALLVIAPLCIGGYLYSTLPKRLKGV
ncbi:hypothetical protein HQ544_04245 [Candidatus Falkowbacteria bacterium]|nr:hypothetical protein [Candidatus Falkowbacteria bacterium]